MSSPLYLDSMSFKMLQFQESNIFSSQPVTHSSPVQRNRKDDRLLSNLYKKKAKIVRTIFFMHFCIIVISFGLRWLVLEDWVASKLNLNLLDYGKLMIELNRNSVIRVIVLSSFSSVTLWRFVYLQKDIFHILGSRSTFSSNLGLALILCTKTFVFQRSVWLLSLAVPNDCIKLFPLQMNGWCRLGDQIELAEKKRLCQSLFLGRDWWHCTAEESPRHFNITNIVDFCNFSCQSMVGNPTP